MVEMSGLVGTVFTCVYPDSDDPNSIWYRSGGQSHSRSAIVPEIEEWSVLGSGPGLQVLEVSWCKASTSPLYGLQLPPYEAGPARFFPKPARLFFESFSLSPD